jgi:HEAT repeat protein
MPKLDIPNPPSNLSYVEFADFQNREILKVNGIQLSEAALVTAVGETTNILQAAAAHVIGTLPSLTVNARAALTMLLEDSNDTVRVEAAYALARHGVSAGTEALLTGIDYPLKASVSPLTAAGYLAALGNPRGFPVIVEGLDSNLAAVRSVASKQLYFFAPFHGSQVQEGKTIDVVRQFERALEDPDNGIQWQALVQLREVALPGFPEFLESYIRNTTDPGLRNLAEAIVQAPVGSRGEKE